jgi:hypothetical protein
MIRQNDPYLGRRIKIVKMWSIGWEYNKLFPNSIHVIIPPRKGEKNGDMGVWVQGIDEPVKVHNDEFIFYNGMQRNK